MFTRWPPPRETNESPNPPDEISLSFVELMKRARRRRESNTVMVKGGTPCTKVGKGGGNRDGQTEDLLKFLNLQ